MARASQYEASKDKVIAELGQVESEDGNLTVRVVAYNGGTPKLAVNRIYYTRKGEPRTSSMGRLTEAELKGLLPLLTQGKKALLEATREPEKA